MSEVANTSCFNEQFKNSQLTITVFNTRLKMIIIIYAISSQRYDHAISDYFHASTSPKMENKSKLKMTNLFYFNAENFETQLVQLYYYVM